MQLMSIDDISELLPPSPVVLISTISITGVRNLAPVGLFMVSSYKPPLVTFAIHDGSDTYSNLKEVAEFVVGIPNKDMLFQLYLCADSISAEEDEFEYAGLTAIKSASVAPCLIKECTINLECKVREIDKPGDHFIVSGEVECANVCESLGSEIRGLREKIESINHIHSDCFTIGYQNIVRLGVK